MAERLKAHEKIGDVVVTEVEILDAAGAVTDRHFVLRTAAGVALDGTYAIKQAATAAAKARHTLLETQRKNRRGGGRW